MLEYARSLSELQKYQPTWNAGFEAGVISKFSVDIREKCIGKKNLYKEF